MGNRIAAIAIVLASIPQAAAATAPTYVYEGKWGEEGAGDGEFSFPAGMAVSSGGLVYVADTGNNRVQFFTAGGNFCGRWGSSGNGDGEFASPVGVAVGGGNVYVVDSYNQRVQYFASSGSFLGKWGAGGTGDGQFQYP